MRPSPPDTDAPKRSARDVSASNGAGHASHRKLDGDITPRPKQRSAKHAGKAVKTSASKAAKKARQAPLRRRAERFINRETSWLEFNRRVLAEADNPRHPLYERVRFLAISGSNMDEFYMVRVAGLREMVRSGVARTSADGLTAAQQVAAVEALANELMLEQRRLWVQLQAELRDAGVAVLSADELTGKEQEWLRTYFLEHLYPLLTPLAVDAAHPFPFVPNLTFNLALLLRDEDGLTQQGLVRIPQGARRFICLPAGDRPVDGPPKKRLVMLETVLSLFLDLLFPDCEILGHGLFRVIRDSDIELEEEAEDLVAHFQSLLKERRRGVLVRLKLDAAMPEALQRFVIDELDATPQDIVPVNGVLGVNELSQLISTDRPDLLFTQLTPRKPERVNQHRGDIFAAIRAKDILVHHPYETFDTVVDFVRQAAGDPKVAAIKQTLYRTSKGSPIVAALCEASEAGKNVTAIVEVKARFDEEANLGFARDLEEAGVQVVYGGFIEMKTHAKLTIVARREGEGLRVYTHVGTGNYHPHTARVYTDVSIFTCDPSFGRDAGRVFNYVTGYAQPRDMEAFSVSPFTMKDELLELIAAEAENARAGKPAAIWAKMNSLVHPELIDALYDASQAGVDIDLIVRGICCLRPQIPGLSENIRVRSIVGRFLEHSRIYAFANGGPMPSDQALALISSADWMPRNLERRVEVMAPVRNATVRRQILDQIMGANIRDERQTWFMNADGAYERHPGYDRKKAFCAHTYLLETVSLSGRGHAKGEGPEPLVWHDED